MNQKIVFAFVIVAVSAVLAHPIDDAVVPPAAAIADAASPSSPAPPAQPEEQPTSPAALLDESEGVTAEAVTLPATQEGSLPAAEQPQPSENVPLPNIAAAAL